MNVIKMGCTWIMEHVKKSFKIFGVTEDHHFKKEVKRNSNSLLLLFMRGTVHRRAIFGKMVLYPIFGTPCVEYGATVIFSAHRVPNMVFSVYGVPKVNFR